MIDLGKHDVLGVGISAVDYEFAVERVMASAAAREPLLVTALAVHGLMCGYRDDEQRYRLNRFDLVLPDGQPVRWALRWLYGVRLPDRVYGPELMLRVCGAAERAGRRVYLFGSTAGVLGRLRSELERRFPRLRIAGARASRFRRLGAEEFAADALEVRASGGEIVFVGLGCPRQEVWIYEMLGLLGCPMLAVGAAFEFIAGVMPQAPAWMQARGLEWLFRLATDPVRLWRRYLLLNPWFLWVLARQALGAGGRARDGGKAPANPLRYG